MWIAVAAAHLAIGAQTANAGAGALDRDFGDRGRVLTPAKISASALNTHVTMARSGNGHIVLAGGQTLVRYLPNGAVDHSFGNNGRRDIPAAGAKRLRIEDVAVDPGGRVIAVGTAWSDGEAAKAFIARFLHNGTPDSSFGDRGDGTLRTDFGFPGLTYTRSSNEVFVFQPAVTASGVAVDAEGRVVITGAERAGASECPKAGLRPYDFGYVARLADNGALDPSFGTGGLVVDHTVAWTGRLARESSGSLLYVGDLRGSCYIGDGGYAGTSLIQLGGEGKPNPSFGSDGRVQLLPHESRNLGLTVDNQGRIWTLTQPSSLETEFRWFNRAIVSRLLPNGSVDMSFGGNGQVMVRLPGEESRLLAIAVDSRGRVLLAGQVSTSTAATRQKRRQLAPMRFALVRLRTSGRLDSRFGHGGRVFTAFGARSRAVGTDLMVDGANRVLVGGAARGKSLMRGGRGFALARYLNGR
jgi:uncharacterized delta-60 repeat protein